MLYLINGYRQHCAVIIYRCTWRHSKVITYSHVIVVGEECHDRAVWNLIKARPDFIDKIFILITVYVELFVNQIYWRITLKMQLVSMVLSIAWREIHTYSLNGVH